MSSYDGFLDFKTPVAPFSFLQASNKTTATPAPWLSPLAPSTGVSSYATPVSKPSVFSTMFKTLKSVPVSKVLTSLQKTSPVSYTSPVSSPGVPSVSVPDTQSVATAGTVQEDLKGKKLPITVVIAVLVAAVGGYFLLKKRG